MILGKPIVVAQRAQVAMAAQQLKCNFDAAAAWLHLGNNFGLDPRCTRPWLVTWDKLLKAPSLQDLQPDTLEMPSYDLAAYLSKRVVQAYDVGQAELAQAVADSGGHNFTPFTEGTDAGYAYTRGAGAVLVFRGTVLNRLRQWFATNFRMRCVGDPGRHLGFEQAWQRLRPQVQAWLQDHAPTGTPLYLSGHSLGGAIALLAAAELSDQHAIRAVVTFGAPRVGTAEFRDAYLSRPWAPARCGHPLRRLAHITRRITHADDLVARVPPPPYFRHIGSEWRLDQEGLLFEGSSRSVHERIHGTVDSCAGWICVQRLHCLRAVGLMPPTALSALLPGALQLGQLPEAAASSHIEQLRQDVGKVFKTLPWLQAYLLQIGVVAVGACAAVYALWSVLLGMRDALAHRSELYSRAMLGNYVALDFGQAPGWHGSRRQQQAALAEAFKRIKAAGD